MQPLLYCFNLIINRQVLNIIIPIKVYVRPVNSPSSYYEQLDLVNELCYTSALVIYAICLCSYPRHFVACVMRILWILLCTVSCDQKVHRCNIYEISMQLQGYRTDEYKSTLHRIGRRKVSLLFQIFNPHCLFFLGGKPGYYGAVQTRNILLR